MLSFLRRARYNPVLSACLYAIARPLFDASGLIHTEIGRKVRRNGGRAIYDGIELKFPINVGADFLSAICLLGTEGFEPYTWRTLRPLIERAGTFIDVGANIGLYSVLARRLNPAIEVISFEPAPVLCADHRRFCEANGVVANVHQLALSDTNGIGMFYQPIEGDGFDKSSAGTIAAAAWQARHQHRAIEVRTITLDEFLAGQALKRPVVVKIDVEDHEAAVLRGAAATIAEYRPTIVCEILPRPLRRATDASDDRPAAEQHENKATLDVLDQIGYCAFAITQNGYFRFSASDFARRRGFTDFLLIPRDSVDANVNYLEPFFATDYRDPRS